MHVGSPVHWDSQVVSHEPFVPVPLPTPPSPSKTQPPEVSWLHVRSALPSLRSFEAVEHVGVDPAVQM